MAVGKVIGWIGLAFVGILMFCWAVLWLEKRFPGRQFDERQQRHRGRACELAIVVGSVYFLGALWVLIHQVDREKTIEPYLLVWIGLMLEIMVMSTYSLLTYSYLSFLQKPWVAILSFGFCGAVQFLNFATNRERYGEFALVGHGTFAWVPLTTGSCFLYLTLVLLIQQLRREKE